MDGLLAQVRLRAGDQRLRAVITADAVKSLKPCGIGEEEVTPEGRAEMVLRLV